MNPPKKNINSEKSPSFFDHSSSEVPCRPESFRSAFLLLFTCCLLQIIVLRVRPSSSLSLCLFPPGGPHAAAGELDFFSRVFDPLGPFLFDWSFYVFFGSDLSLVPRRRPSFLPPSDLGELAAVFYRTRRARKKSIASWTCEKLDSGNLPERV